MVPRAYGVAPTFLTADGEVLAAVAAGEAVWLGFSAVDRAVSVHVVVDDELLEELTIPPASRLDAIFTVPQRLRIVVVDPRARRRTSAWCPRPSGPSSPGAPRPPLDLTRGYTGLGCP